MTDAEIRIRIAEHIAKHGGEKERKAAEERLRTYRRLSR